MQAILNVKSNEIDFPELEEFDRNVSLDEKMREFKKSGYSQGFLSDLKKGFKTSEIYNESNENKTAKSEIRDLEAV